MAKGEGGTSYLTWIKQVKHELAVVGEKIYDVDLVHVALGGFTKQWDTFVKCIVARENLPNW